MPLEMLILTPQHTSHKLSTLALIAATDLLHQIVPHSPVRQQDSGLIVLQIVNVSHSVYFNSQRECQFQHITFSILFHLLSAAVIECGPPPTRVNCSIDSPMNGCGSVATYAPVDPETIHVVGDTTLTCGPSGMWEANISQSEPICVPSKPLQDR